MKKSCKVLGILIGLAFVLVGILAMSGALGAEVYYPDSAPFGYESGYATFGADYYTYSVNNMAEAGDGARAAGANLYYIGNFLKIFCGLTSMLFGFLVMCIFGGLNCCSGKEKVTETVIEETAIPEVPEEETASEATEEQAPEAAEEQAE